MRLVLLLALLALAACSGTSTGNYQEPGEKAGCDAHPHYGWCP